MKASPGVIVIACLTLVGSALFFLMGIGTGLMLASMPAQLAKMPQQPPPPAAFFEVMGVVCAIMYIGPAIWGFVTGIGLFKLKNWARISTIVFSILLICMAVFSMIGMGLVGYSTVSAGGLDRSVMAALGVMMAVFWVAHITVGVWWLVYLTRPKVRAQFVRTTSQAGSELPSPIPGSMTLEPEPQSGASKGRKVPVSISIIAWWMLIGCAFVPINILMKSPVVLFTTVLTGLPSIFYFIGIMGLHAFIGIGLLRLKPAARITCIALLIFGMANSGVFFFAPGRATRISALLQRSMAMYSWVPSNKFQMQIDPTPFMYVGLVFGFVVALVPLYYLVTRKQAFEGVS